MSALAVEVGNQVGKLEGQAAGNNELRKLLDLVGNPYGADYEVYIPTALLVTLALKKWVSKNETKFQNYYSIKSGLESLFKELGGLA